MSELAIIGDRDTIMGFRALGLSTHAFASIEGLDETVVRSRLKDLLDEKPKIVFVTELFHQRFGTLLLRLRGQALLPLFVPVPSNRGSLGLGLRKMEKLVERAIGAKLLGDDPSKPEGESE